MEARNQRTDTPVDFIATVVGMSEAGTRDVLYKKLSLKVLQYSQETQLC